jgi:tetratricopeptide (TPR) repeat protein
MRRPLFWGAVTLILLIAVGLGFRPAGSLFMQFVRNQRIVRQARGREKDPQTPKQANTIAMHLNSLGNACDDRRQYAAALQYYRRALEVARKFNLRARAEASLEMMGNTFGHMGIADSAEVYFQKAQEVAAVDTTPGRVTSSLADRAIALIRNPETNDSALAMLRRALEQAQTARTHRDVPWITYNLGICYLYRDEPDSCITILRRYVKIYRGPARDSEEACVLHNVALAFCQKSEWDSAYASYQKALADYQAINDKVNTWFVQEDIRDLGELAGDPSSYPLPPGPVAGQPYRGAQSDLHCWYMLRHVFR